MFADAEAYMRFMGRWSRLVAGPLIEFAGVPDTGRFLDVGSGAGSLSFGLAERRPQAQVFGIDLSPKYVDYATSRNRFRRRVRFETGDAQRLPFPDASFDASLSLLVLNFIPNPAKAMLEQHRVTKPGGRITAAVWDYGEGMQMLRVFWDSAVRVDPKAERLDEKHMPLCRPGELSRLFQECGLADVAEQGLTITTQFESFADYWDPFLLGQGPAGAYVKELSSDLMARLRAEVKSRISPRNEKDPIAMTARVWVARGAVPVLA